MDNELRDLTKSTTKTGWIDLIEAKANIRGDPIVPRDYIVEAIEKIERNEVLIERYPRGQPTFREFYRVASQLYEESKR